MLELVKSLLSPSQYIPHGHCYLWQTPLVWLHLVSDALIAVAYFSIPAMLIYFVRKRGDIPFSKVFLLFGAFIVLCGTGHLLDIWTLWHPAYWVSGVEQAVTALVSCYTALQLVELLPQFLALQTPERLEAINRELEQQIQERHRAEATLQTIVAGTSSVTGNDFFPALVQNLAAALNVAYVMVCETVDGSLETLRSLAFWAGEHLADNIEYTLPNTPCQIAIEGRALSAYSDQLQQRFPACQMLKDLAVESYIGVPLLDMNQHPIGHLCIFDVKPLRIDDRTKALLSVFAARAATELQRKWAEDEKHRAYEELEFRVNERTVALVQTNSTLEREIQERIAAEGKLQQVAQRERATARVIQRMRQSLDLDTIFQTTTEELQQAIGCDRTLIYSFNPDWSGQVLAESVTESWRPILPYAQAHPIVISQTVDQSNCIIQGLNHAEVLIRDTYLQTTQGGLHHNQSSYYRVVTDIYQQGFNSCYLELLESIQARSYVIVPIFCGSQLWGLLAAYQNSSPRHWQTAEVQMVLQISDQLGVAVQQAELFAQTQEQGEQLKQAKEAADAANHAKSEFLASMSHELRTPLNVILGLTQLMNLDQQLTPEHQHYLQTISDSGEHLLGLINEVLEMSKIEAGRLTVHTSSFNLQHLLDSLHEMLTFRATSKGLQFDLQCSSALPEVIQTDEGKLRQILINLVGNAIKFTQRGRVVLRVGLADADAQAAEQYEETRLLFPAAVQDIHLLFEVEDTGPGIAPNELKLLFQPFQQTRSGLTATEGSGLGLAISQKYAQLLGGQITARSQLGQGSVFSLHIAAVPGNPSPTVKTPAIAGKVIGLAPQQSSYRILIAEDNPANRLVLRKLLTTIGFELKEASNGQEAVELWQSWKPHLIFMDIQMPVLDGYEATQRIRMEEQQHHQTASGTKILALTASAFSEQREETLTAGCNDFIRKPFKAQEILEKIAHYLNVEYVYDTTTENPGESTQPAVYATLTTAQLQSMPSAWIDQLHLAAIQGNDLQILKLIQDIPPVDSTFAKTLQQFAENFQFDKIIDAISQFR